MSRGISFCPFLCYFVVFFSVMNILRCNATNQWIGWKKNGKEANELDLTCSKLGRVGWAGWGVHWLSLHKTEQVIQAIIIHNIFQFACDWSVSLITTGTYQITFPGNKRQGNNWQEGVEKRERGGGYNAKSSPSRGGQHLTCTVKLTVDSRINFYK